uniref:non-specific serine/threonine protein kinase n=1 Tax=Tanacetum cinerariifolium TaxID=118510 RepID=A0A699I2J4_TANCI|nr:armadillo-like helical [Tanacetum cinerariifolium]
MTTRGRKKAVVEPAPPACDPRDVETIERLQQRIQELEAYHVDGGGIVYYYDTDNKEEESMPVYDTDIEDIIEGEEGFVGKGGPNEEEEDGDKDEVVYVDHINQNEFNGSVNNDSSPIIRSAALETLCEILPLVRDFPPSDAKIFPEYTLLMLSMLPDDPKENKLLILEEHYCKMLEIFAGSLVRDKTLGDSTKAVIVNALDCLAILCKSGILRKRILLEMIEHPFPLLCYPSQWVRRSVVTFISTSSESLRAIDSYVFLVPLIRPFLRRQSASLAYEKALFTCLKPPVSRQDHKSITSTMQSFSLGENNVEARLRTIGSFDSIDPSFLDKLKFSGFMPRGVLVAHLQEHRSAVNDIYVSTNHSFFVTASDDSTVKVKDSRELEKDISFRSRLTYCLDGSRALCATMLHGSAQVVVRASDGTIHMFSVDYISRGLRSVVEKYSRIVDVKKNNIGEGAILALLNYSSGSDDGKMILYSTQKCGIHLGDTKENSRTSFSQAGENDVEALTFSQSQNA